MPKQTKKKGRNWIAVHAFQRGSVRHSDRKKEASRRACRKRVER